MGRHAGWEGVQVKGWHKVVVMVKGWHVAQGRARAPMHACKLVKGGAGPGTCADACAHVLVPQMHQSAAWQHAGTCACMQMAG
eukprot:364169-Chlamydomonas_euryale.AAC.6